MKKTGQKPAAAKAAKPPKPAHLSLARLQGEITSLRHQVQSLKHAPSRKGKAKASSKHGSTAAHAKRGLALRPGVDVASCSAEALAASLRLAGGTVSDADVLGLYWLTASHPDAGATLLGTLRAAQAYGLAGHFPVWRPAEHLCAGVVLGCTLPGGLHAVTLGDAGAWSWGDLYDLDELGITSADEAWEVRWAA